MPPYFEYTEDDWEVAGRTLFGEARNEPFEAQVAVAWVIRNRAAKPGWWGRGVTGVCLHDRQFSCWNDGDPNRDVITAVKPANSKFRRALSIVGLVMSGDLEDPTDGATHYWTTAKPPYAKTWPPTWAGTLKTTGTHGAHVFQREFREGEHA